MYLDIFRIIAYEACSQKLTNCQFGLYYTTRHKLTSSCDALLVAVELSGGDRGFLGSIVLRNCTGEYQEEMYGE